MHKHLHIEKYITGTRFCKEDASDTNSLMVEFEAPKDMEKLYHIHKKW